MARDLPYIGICYMPQVQANSYPYLRWLTKTAMVAPSGWHNETIGSYGTPISDRVYSFTTRRGRTYELGRIESGECDLAVNNSDGLFDPNNSSSAFYPNVLPYRPVSINCAYPLTGNVLNDNNLSLPIASTAPSSYANYRLSVGANDGNFELNKLSNWFTNTTLATFATDNARAYSGTYSLKIAGSLFAGATGFLDVPVVAGTPTTISFYYYQVSAPASALKFYYDDGSAGTTGGVPNGTYVNLASSIGTWTRYTLTLTPKTQRVTIGFSAALDASAVATWVDNVQVEFGSSATAYSSTGPTVYSLFNGFIERYPQTYQAPNRGQVNMVATDVIGSMSQNILGNVYEALVLQDASPALYYYPLGEESTSTYAYNNGIYTQQPLSPYTKGTTTAVTFGETSASTGVLGAGTTGVTLRNANATGINGTLNGTALVNNNVSDIVFKANDTYTFSFWVRFNEAPLASATSYELLRVSASNASLSTNPYNAPSINVHYGFDGTNYFIEGQYYDGVYRGPASNVLRNLTGFSTGTWYFVSFSLNWTGTTANFSLTVPAVSSTAVTSSNASTYSPIFTSINLMGVTQTAGTTFAHLTVNRGAITATTYDTIGRYGLYGDSTGTRFKNMVNAYSGMKYLPYAPDYGKSFMQNAITEGTSLGDYIQTIADTENGTWYVDGEGFVNFKDRWNRLQKLVPSVTFGDGTGETPYEGGDLLINFDPTYVLNDVMINRANGVTVAIQDQTSLVNYYPRSYSRTIQSLADSDANDAANFLLSRYKDPHARPETLTLTPARNPSVFPVALNLEIGDLVRVNKRPLGAPAISIDCFVERVEHGFDAQSGDWITHVTLSPTIVYYWNLSAMRATTTGAAVAGSYVFTKSATTGAGLNTPRDIRPGQMLQYTLSGTTYVDVVSGAPTETSTTVTVPALRVGSFTSSVNSLNKATLNTDIKMDALGTATLSTVLNDGTYLIDEEIITGTMSSTTTLTITARAQNSTIQTASGSSSTYTASHLSGATVYSVAATSGGNVATGTVVTEFLPNQLTQIPYTVPTYTNYDLTSKLGSWTGVLLSGTVTTTTPPSGIKINTLSMFALTDGNNYPSSDLCVGQMLSVLNTAGTVENAGIIATSTPAVDGSWSLSVYKITDSGQTLSAAISPDATTVTCSGNVTASAILVGNEWMQVTGGSGTPTLAVTRGTPDGGVYGVRSKAPHYQYDKIYTVVNAGLTNTYAQGNSIIEGYNVSTPVIGTARLGY